MEGETGLYYNNARWYDPTLHRFISQDPIGIDGGINLYAYTGNDPVNFVDPAGLKEDPVCVALIRSADPFLSLEDAKRLCAVGVAPLIVTAHNAPSAVPASSCDYYGCELEYPTPAERAAVISILRDGMKPGHPECVATQQAGLDAVNRMLLVFRNVVHMPADRKTKMLLEGHWSPGQAFRPLVGNSPFDYRLDNPGPVMYIYLPRGTQPNPQIVWHEADHDVIVKYLGGLPVYRGEFDHPPHGDRDHWASACRKR